MKILFILNPIAGHGSSSAINILPSIDDFCKDEGIDYKIIQTEYKGHAIELAKEAKESDADIVVAVGGDGTLLEVANGLMGSDKILGIIPAGSGNDFSRAISVPHDTISALELLKNGKPKFVDVGKIKGIYFINVASVGLDAEIARDVMRYKRFLPGGISYYIVAVLKLFTYKFKEMSLFIDGKPLKSKFTLVAVANGTHYGGGMKVNPEGLVNDGFLNVIAIDSVPRYKMPSIMLKFFKGKHIDLPYVRVYKCKNINIMSSHDLVINLDGEVLNDTPINFSVNPQALNIIGG